MTIKLARQHAMANALAVLCNETPPFGGRQLIAGKRVPCFEDAANEFIAQKAPTWKGKRVEANWRSSLAKHVYPKLGKMPVDRIRRSDVIALLDPLSQSNPATAKIVRQRASAVFGAMIAREHISQNPCADIDGALPSLNREVTHRKALDYGEVPEAFAKLAAVTGSQRGAALGLSFLILTGTRRDEARQAQWCEIDTDAKLWTVPGSRMKSGEPHRIPLSAGALAVLAEARKLGCKPDLVFCGARGGQVSESAFLDLLGSLGIECTVHGMRASFRTWASENGIEFDVAERCIGHDSGDATVKAYARSDLLAARVPVMEAWSTYLNRRRLP